MLARRGSRRQGCVGSIRIAPPPDPEKGEDGEAKTCTAFAPSSSSSCVRPGGLSLSSPSHSIIPVVSSPYSSHPCTLIGFISYIRHPTCRSLRKRNPSCQPPPSASAHRCQVIFHLTGSTQLCRNTNMIQVRDWDQAFVGTRGWGLVGFYILRNPASPSHSTKPAWSTSPSALQPRSEQRTAPRWTWSAVSGGFGLGGAPRLRTRKETAWCGFGST